MDSLLFVVVYFPLVFALYIFTKHFVHKLRNLPPSPLLVFPFFGHLPLLKKPFHHTFAELSNRYGPVVLLQIGSRRVLHVSSPSAAEECLTKNDVIFANRPNFLAGVYIGYNYTTIGWSNYGDLWRNLRKISSTEVLSSHRLTLLQRIRAEEVTFMIARLKRAASEGQLVDMKAVFFDLTTNVLTRMIAGKRYCDENVEEAEEAKRFRQIIKEIFQNTEINYWDFFPRLRWLRSAIGAEKRMAKLCKRRDDFIQGLLEEHKRNVKSTTTTKTMMEVMLELQEKDPLYYTDQLITSFLVNLLEAGTETTSGTMEWGLSLLLNNPHVLRKAQLEIESCVGNERLVVESDIDKLPYLRGIVNETLRMYPVGPFLLPHQSLEPCTVQGYHVPGNTVLALNCWALQNDPKYVKDPLEFKPERFVNGDNKIKIWAFGGGGRRSCPGEGLAMRMLGVGLGSVIQCFDWEAPGKALVDMTETLSGTIFRTQPLMAYCKPRPVLPKIFP